MARKRLQTSIQRLILVPSDAVFRVDHESGNESVPEPPQGTRKCPKHGFLQIFVNFSARDQWNLFFDEKMQFFWIFARSDLRNHVFNAPMGPRGAQGGPTGAPGGTQITFLKN